MFPVALVFDISRKVYFFYFLFNLSDVFEFSNIIQKFILIKD